MKLTPILAILFLSLVTARAVDSDALLKNGLIHPEVILAHQSELNLSADQQKRLGEIVEVAKPKVEPLESVVRSAQQKLEALLRSPETKSDDAVAQLSKVLEAEAELKELQLRVLVELRLILTPEQRTKAMAAAGKSAGSTASLEVRVREEAERMKKTFEGLGVPLTDALKERGKAVESMIKDGQLEPALKAMGQLAKDTGLDEPAKKETPDFAKLNPGDTDVGVLGQRLEAVTDKAQKVISIPVLRQLMQAREALEKAKDNSDAEAVGRVLTFAENLLNKK
jgi:Spy/CpxP family protein refolding chaperone